MGGPKDKTKLLSKLIIQVKSCLTQESNRCDKDYIVRELHKIGVSRTTIDAINNIKTREYTPSHLAQYCAEYKEYDNNVRAEYVSSVNSIIDMLTREKQRFEKMKEAELQQRAIAEQKKGNEIQKRALYVSIVAIIISLLSLVVAFFK